MSLRIFLFFYLSLTYTVFAQSNSNKSLHPLSNSIGIAMEFGGTLPKTDYKIDELSISGRLLAEYFFTSHSIHSLGVRILGGAGILRGKVFSNDFTYPPVSDHFNTDFYFGGCGITYAINFTSNIPYFSASASYTYFNPLDNNGYQLPNNQFSIYENGTMMYSLETGVRFPFSDDWSLNLAANINFLSTDYLDDVKAGANNDAYFGIYTGFSFYLGQVIDQDNDGVADNIDLCPNTKDGAEVNEFGCSLDDLNSKVLGYNALKDQFLMDGVFTDGKIFCFQVDVFDEKNSAEKLQNKLLLLGYKANIIETNFGSRVWYSVRIGYFNSYDDAKYFKNNFFKETILKLK